MSRRLPKYRKHKRGQAFVVIEGKHHWLGKHGTPESLKRYDQILGEWIANGTVERTPDKGAQTVAELADLYVAHCADYYANRYAAPAMAKLIKRHFAALPAREFGPRLFQAFQQKLVGDGLTRRYINDTCDRVRQMFRWGVVREYITAEQLGTLQAVPNLRQGKSDAKEKPPILPVEDSVVDATLPHLPATVADMVRFQRLTGCRPAEARILRPIDVDTTGDVWVYRPAKHKNEHRGKLRMIAIGPQAQQVLRPRLLRPSDHYCFASDTSGESCYTKDTYARAIKRACERAELPHWAPNQLRHTAATEIRKVFGLESAQVALGHSKANTTEIYAERDLAKAVEVARQIG